MIVLDSDILIDLLRRCPPSLAWLDSLQEKETLLPGYVVMELLQGCRNKAEQKESLQYYLEAPLYGLYQKIVMRH